LAIDDHQVYLSRSWHRMSDKRKIAMLRRFAAEHGRDPALREFTINKVLRPAGAFGTDRDYPAQIRALLAFAQTFSYVNEPDEQLQSPYYTLKVRFADCDDLAILIASMAHSIRLPYRFVLMGKGTFGKPVRWIEGTRMPRGVRFHHVYLQLGWPPFKPKHWVTTEPTLPGAPPGYDVALHGMPPRGPDGRYNFSRGAPGAAFGEVQVEGEEKQKSFVKEVAVSAAAILAVNAVMLGLASWAKK